MDKLKVILFFDTMITPKVITLLYWIVMVLIIFSGIFMMTQSVLQGLAILVGGTIVYRVLFEMIIIAFKNNEYLKKIAEKE